RVLERSTLKDLDREYTLYEIAIITRAAPARMLGLPHKGHLGIGADADIAVYTPSADRLAMFELPRWVLKAGEIVVEQGEIRREAFGRTLRADTQYDGSALPDIRQWFEQFYTIQFENYSVDEHYVANGTTAVACRPPSTG